MTTKTIKPILDWTLYKVRTKLPSFRVVSKNGKLMTAYVRSPMGIHATVKIDGKREIELSWLTIVYSLNRGEPIEI